LIDYYVLLEDELIVLSVL